MHDLVSGWMDRCMNKWIDRWTDGLMVGWKDMSGLKDISGQMDEILSLEVNKWMDGRADEMMYREMDGCVQISTI